MIDDITPLKKQILALIIVHNGLTLTSEQQQALDDDSELQADLSAIIEKVSRVVATAENVDEVPHTPAPAADEPATAESETGSDPASWQKMPYHELDEHCAQEEKPVNKVVQTLKPGQVPEHPADAGTRVVNPPVARIGIANARAGTPFHCAVDITLDNGECAEVQDVIFDTPCGLTFNKDDGTLSGTPVASGDIGIRVRWCSPSCPDGESRLTFIVNPDPRTLWKDIDPPEDDRYYKKNVDRQLIQQSGVNIVAASRRGRSHAHVGSFRDDDFYVNHSQHSGWSIMLVADGAGSASYSRRGSLIATETVGNYLFDQLKDDQGLALKTQITQWNTDDQRQIWDYFYRQFSLACALAVNNINHEAKIAGEKSKSYSTTLLAVVSFRESDELFAAAFWLGDGAIAACGPAGKVRVLGMPDSGEYAGQTRFLDADTIHDADFSKRIIIGRWKDISHLVLMTDGISDPFFETDNGLLNPQKWDALIAELTPHLEESDTADERLIEWLNFFSPGNHDDRTIVISW